ncbi:hypothetical protein MVLG_05774 [Microbotryum lychnidis-dioicae p1A1 Lamole]|uniref:Mitochondrial escape protein 2 n=1 Tax=Microbotryum lychnidis-dioicae (strain p1A1 Lamole / MvSl-1064) TaxID=683840 RepID=U5HF94_USTV1|nr:hypothetical protein MVLG_05774 [Microbotryum lychnidis-dioicae p1A1 Lamole]|eukprot:KDE03772.1 hypothetical protein MVLG_05774 [Microbotryum lychnidis-dioicae p1A1 Lamole]
MLSRSIGRPMPASSLLMRPSHRRHLLAIASTGARPCRPFSSSSSASALDATAALASLTPEEDSVTITSSSSTPKPLVETRDPEKDPMRKTSYLYFNTVFPIRLAAWDLREVYARLEENKLLQEVRSIVPEDPLYDLKVEQVTPRAKDGGAFVRFSWSVPTRPFLEHDPVALDKAAREADKTVVDALYEIESEAKTVLKSRELKPWWEFSSRWFSWAQPQAFLVKGKPWMEDMNRFPNSTIRIEFEGPEIPQEELYEVFRPYGRIVDIIPQSPSSKDTPRYANITFRSIRSAASARNCLHSAVVPSSLPVPNPPPPTVLRILYAERQKAHYIKDFVTTHPRIVIPLIVALLGAISLQVFDPIREFFVSAHVEGTFDSDRWTIVRWLKRETLGRLGLTKYRTLDGAEKTGIEREREAAKEQLLTWLRDAPETFTMVTGPKGSGKTMLIDEVARHSKHVLVIDCTQLCRNGRSDQKLIQELASSVGYRPLFTLGASVNNLIDLASMSLIGQKAGFSASLNEQLKAILEVTASALNKIATTATLKASTAAKNAEAKRLLETSREAIVAQLETEGIRDGRVDAVAGNGAMSELGGGIEKPEEQGHVTIVGPNSANMVKALACEKDSVGEGDTVAALPIVVLKGFAAKGESKQEVLWDVLADWAALLVENKVAHVVFTSDSVTASKPLSRALPNKPFNVIALNDASPEAAIQFVEAKLAEFEKTLPLDAHEHVWKLGGRQTDLELLVSKIHAGAEPNEAVQDIVSRNATEIRKTFFGDDESEAKGLKWTREQAWKILTGLTGQEELKYADVLFNAPFKSDEAALRSLENSEFIIISHRDGRPSTIRPGKPVYRSAFSLLLSDSVFRSSIEFQINASAINTTTTELNAASKSLIELSQLFGDATGTFAFGGGRHVPREIEVRVAGLLGKMRECEDKLERLEEEKKDLLRVLKEAS